MLWRLILAGVSFAGVALIITQIIWPVIYDRPTFPIFRYWKSRKAYAEAREKRRAAQIEQDARDLEVEAASIEAGTRRAYAEAIEDLEAEEERDRKTTRL